MKLLIADDSAVVRERMKQTFMEIEGIEVVAEATTTAEAIKMLTKHKPDIMLLDLRFPEGSGLDVIKHINSSENKPVIIIMTTYAYPQYRKRCLELGVEYFFDKSTQFDQVVETVAEMVKKRQLESV